VTLALPLVTLPVCGVPITVLPFFTVNVIWPSPTFAACGLVTFAVRVWATGDGL